MKSTHYTVLRERVLAQLQSELDAILGFEKNANGILTAMRRADPFADIEAQARGLRYNQQMANAHLERASAVLELLGEEPLTRDANADTLAAAIDALK